MRAGIEAEELAVQHVREARNREPVGDFGRRERPLDAVGGDAGADVAVGGDVIGIVEVDEVEVEDAGVDGAGEEKKCESEVEIRAGFRNGPWLGDNLRTGFRHYSTSYLGQKR